MNLLFYLKLLKVYISYRFKEKAIPAIVTLRISYNCNQKCFFCRLWKFPEVKELSLNQIKKLLDDLHRIGVPYLNITGGEPLLRKDIEEIGKYSTQKGIFTTLNTNGTIINSKRAERLARSFDIIKVSLDGFEKTHDRIRGENGAFKKANNGLKNLLAVKGRRAKVMIHFVANEHNICEIPDFARSYHKMVDAVTIMPAFDMRKGEALNSKGFLRNWQTASKACNLQESQFILSRPDFKKGKKYCDAAELYYSVTPEGKVVCCSNFFVVLGDLKKETFFDIWQRKLTKEQEKKINVCKGCFCRSTIEISMIMRKNPLELLFAAPKLIKKYRF